MQTWAKYALSFFALILVLTGFIYAFGPASTRAAFRSGETQTGQLRADHQTVSPGEPVPQGSVPAETASGMTQPATGAKLESQPQGPQPLTNTPGSPYSAGDKSGNPEAVNAK